MLFNPIPQTILVGKHSLSVIDLEVSASHFIHTTERSSKCQCLHGHNYYVSVNVEVSKLPDDGMVIDVSRIKEIIMELDHKTLVPQGLLVIDEDVEYYGLKITNTEPDYHIIEIPGDFKYVSRYYLFPAEACVVLPLDSISAEKMAQYYAEKIMDESNFITKVIVGVAETRKMTAWYELTKK